MTPFARGLAQAASNAPDIEPFFSLSRQNEDFASFQDLGERLWPVDTFETGPGALAGLWRLPGIKRDLLRRLRQARVETVVVLMSHVWTPLVGGAIRRAGIGYAVVVHDAERHPGDPTGLVLDWQLRDIASASTVATLSSSVAGTLARRFPGVERKTATLFHPDFAPVARTTPQTRQERLGLLFLGRILPYKGLEMLVEAVEILRNGGIRVRLGVFGEGDISGVRERLERLGAEIVNRWLTEAEIAAALASYDAVALSHLEASQSGVAALALGHGLPVIATPVGGLTEQIEDGENGIVAASARSQDFARAVKRLLDDPSLHGRLAANIARTRESRSMARFLRALVQAVTVARVQPGSR